MRCAVRYKLEKPLVLCDHSETSALRWTGDLFGCIFGWWVKLQQEPSPWYEKEIKSDSVIRKKNVERE